MEKLNSICYWEIDDIYIDGEIEYGVDDYSKDDFLKPLISETSKIEVGGIYLFGFNRTLLCEVVDISSEYCNRGAGYDQTLKSLYLKTIVDLDEQTISIKRVGDNSYLMEISK